MSRIITNNLRHNDATADNLTLDGTGNITAPGNLSVTGTSTLTDDLNVDSGTLFVDASTDLVGIGTTSPDNKLHVFAGDSSGSSSAQAQFTIENSGNSGLQFLAGTSSVSEIRFGDSGDNGAGSIAYFHSDNSLRFGTNNGTERLRIASDGTVQLRNSPGIDFSQIQTNASAMLSETLDSYEEGRFTPRIQGYTGSTYANVTNTTSYEPGLYVKVGRRVTVFIRYEWTSMPIAQSRPWYIYDLPFTPSTQTNATGVVYTDSITNAYSLIVTKSVNYATPLFIHARTSNTTNTTLLSYSGSSGFLSTSITYWTDS